MKKILISLIALFAIGIECSAQTFSVAGDVQALSAGETVSFKLHVAGVTAMTSTHFEIVLPSGFSVNDVKKNSTLWDCIVAREGGVVSATSTSTDAFTGEGDLFTVEVTVPAETALGNYPVTINNIRVNGNNIATTVEFNIVVVNVKTIILDETSTTAPEAATGVNVTVKRTITANEWSTICLPFAMSKTVAEAVFGNDVQVMTYNGYTADIDLNTMIPSEITVNFATYTMNALVGLKAGTPYLIKTSKNIESFDVNNVNIVEGTTDVSGNETTYGLDGKFKGVLAKTTVPDKGLFVSGNKFYYSTGKTTIKAFRGWFDLQAIYNEAVVVNAPIHFSFDGDGGTTGIKNVQQTIGDNKYYNLSGQYVKNPGKGLYIKNGKKIVIK